MILIKCLINQMLKLNDNLGTALWYKYIGQIRENEV